MRYLEMCWCIFKFSYFPDIFLLLALFKWVMAWEHTLYDLSSFNFVLVCFVAQNLVYLGECPMCIWEECVICYSWVVFCKYQLRHVSWWCCSKHVYIYIYLYWFSASLFCYTRERTIAVSKYKCGFPIFPFRFIIFCYVFRSSDVRCINGNLIMFCE